MDQTNLQWSLPAALEFDRLDPVLDDGARQLTKALSRTNLKEQNLNLVALEDAGHPEVSGDLTAREAIHQAEWVVQVAGSGASLACFLRHYIDGK